MNFIDNRLGFLMQLLIFSSTLNFAYAAPNDMLICNQKILNGEDNLYLALVKSTYPESQQVNQAEEIIAKQRKLKPAILKLAPFHLRSNSQFNDRNKSNAVELCIQCHSVLPHRANASSRTYNNMHSRFIACQTCHLEAEGLAITYDWYDGLGKSNNSKQVHSGALPSRKKLLTRSKESQIAFSTANSKITPFYYQQSLYLSNEHPFSVCADKLWQGDDLGLRAFLHVGLHKPLMAEGRTCSRCHNADHSLLSLKQLGASKEQENAFLNNTVARFFVRLEVIEKQGETGGVPRRLRISELLR